MNKQTRFASLFLFVALSFSTTLAQAAITVEGVDSKGVSNVAGLGTSVVTIFGGVAGKACGASRSHTCSSCLPTATQGDSGLTSCNDRRINPNLIVKIALNSNTLDGYAGISSANGAYQSHLLALTPLLISKGQAGLVSIPWSKLCKEMVIQGSSTGAHPTACNLGMADYAQGIFYVGIKSTGDSMPFSTADDYQQIKVVLGAGELAQAPSLADFGGPGITSFEIFSGENRATLGSVSYDPGSGFPNGQHMKFDSVRVLFEKRRSVNTSVWSLIDAGSPHVDLAIDASGPDLVLSPVTFTEGIGHTASGQAYQLRLLNGNAYDFKVGVVDQAGNAEFYTPAKNDQDCANKSTRNPSSGVFECHTARPDRVRGH
jgi:hypothetical protein